MDTKISVRVTETTVFSNWLGGLRDVAARRAITRRLTRLAATGHFGDIKAIEGNLFEMRFHVGPGYRVYYTLREDALVLCGGDKGSQRRDIETAKSILSSLT